MTHTYPGGQPLRTLLFALAGMAICASGAGAARDAFDIELKELKPAPSRSTAADKDTFDIELKELRPAPGRRDAAPRPARPSKPASDTPPPQAGRESSYTVRPGDNLFLILIRQYGLSNSAAERLIPEIVRRNNMSEAQKLTVGQRLIIPLPGKARKATDISPHTEPPAAQPPAPPLTAPPAENPQEREIVLMGAPPCQLARNVAKKLGLQIPPLSALSHPDSVSVAYDGQKMGVTCELPPAEAYTLERLLTPHGIQLLVFNGEVPPRRVVEELADRLGITFWLADEHASDELPVTYIFPAANPDEKGIRLTILPAPASQTP